MCLCPPTHPAYFYHLHPFLVNRADKSLLRLNSSAHMRLQCVGKWWVSSYIISNTLADLGNFSLLFINFRIDTADSSSESISTSASLYQGSSLKSHLPHHHRQRWWDIDLWTWSATHNPTRVILKVSKGAKFRNTIQENLVPQFQ